MSWDITLKQSLSMGQVVVLSINQVIEMKGLNHYLLCPMKRHTSSIPIKIMHAKLIMNLFDANHPITIPLKLTEVTSYFNVRKPT